MLPFFRSKTQIIYLLLVETIVFVFFILGSYTSALSSQAIISLTNSERSANGLSQLSTNSALNSSASLKAQDMCDKDYWAHTSPDGKTGWTFMSQAGYAYVSAGENLAKDYDSDSGVVSGWMNSATHRANILSTTYAEIGVASLNCNETLLVVAHYGVRANSKTPVASKVETTKPQPKPAPVKQQAVIQNEVKPAKPSESLVIVSEAPAEEAKQEAVVIIQKQNSGKTQDKFSQIENLTPYQNMDARTWSYLVMSMGVIGLVRLRLLF